MQRFTISHSASARIWVFCLVVFASSITRGQNLLVNGSFESPSLPSGYEYVSGGSTTITGWQTLFDGVERFSMAAGLPNSSGTAQDGLLLIDLNTDGAGGTSFGGIQQSVPTTVGVSYLLTYYVGTLKDAVASGVGNITVSAGGVTDPVTVTNFTNTLQWTKFSLSFTATSANTLISFKNFDPPHLTYDFLDNVSLVGGCQVTACDPAHGTMDTCVSLTIGAIPGWPPQTSMDAVFIPPSGMTVANYAHACGFDELNWQQITAWPSPNPLRQLGPGGTSIPLPSWPGTFFDPPPMGYAVPNFPSSAYPFYYDETELSKNPTVCALNETEGAGTIPLNALCFHDAPADACLQGGDPTLQKQLCGGVAAQAGAAMIFDTSLVGANQAYPQGQVLSHWTWVDNFNGTADGFIVIPSNPGPVDPGSGTGGVTITSINGVPQTPPSVSCTATPNTLWPPNGQPVSVTVSGIITAGTSPLAPSGTNYLVLDEYGQDQPNGPITLGSGGSYLFQVSLIASRHGDDRDGRTYTIIVNGQDTLGNVGSCSSVVTVPHDQGQ